MRRKVVIDGHRIQGREAMEGVELTVPAADAVLGRNEFLAEALLPAYVGS